MSEDNVRSLSDKKVQRLIGKGNYYGLMERFELLRLKFIYKDTMSKEDALDFIVLVKYFLIHGQTEGMRYSCKQIMDAYITPNGL